MRQFATQVSAKSFDGLLVIEPEGTLDYIAELHRHGLPIVLIDDRGNQPLFPSVATTNHTGAAQAARHLLAIGRRRPLVVQGMDVGCTKQRLAGFGDTFAAAGFPIDPELVRSGDFTFECGRAAVRDALSRGIRFDAVFAHNDLSAAGAIKAAHEAGLDVPRDVAVVGFDDIPLAAHTDPPLTTVHQPLRQMGETAARMLMNFFAGTPLPDSPNVIPTSLIVRASTAG
jgi:LacI family transcriptional regulator